MFKIRFSVLLGVLIVLSAMLVHKFFLKGNGLHLQADFPSWKRPAEIASPDTENNLDPRSTSADSTSSGKLSAGRQLATFGSGCFWCTEAFFEELPGVERVQSGYSGGKEAWPTYQEVCSGQTGHAEVVQIEFNPDVISYADLLEVFWRTHDPTTLNRQGNDFGTQYRSVVFTHSDRQEAIARSYLSQLESSGVFGRKIVTELQSYSAFYPAEEYHQDYWAANSDATYCRLVIGPKIKKFKPFMERRFSQPETAQQ